MSTTPPACTVPKCKEPTAHHHYRCEDFAPPCDPARCIVPNGNSFRGPLVGPRAKSARIEALTAENEALIERGWADEKKIVDLAAEVARLSAQVESDALVIASLGQQIAATPEPEPVDPDAVAIDAIERALEKVLDGAELINTADLAHAALTAAREAGAL